MWRPSISRRCGFARGQWEKGDEQARLMLIGRACFALGCPAVGVFSDGQRAQGFIASAGRGFAHGHLFRTGTPSFAQVVRLFGIQASAAPYLLNPSE
jgi:hypothetical protein